MVRIFCIFPFFIFSCSYYAEEKWFANKTRCEDEFDFNSRLEYVLDSLLLKRGLSNDTLNFYSGFFDGKSIVLEYQINENMEILFNVDAFPKSGFFFPKEILLDVKKEVNAVMLLCPVKSFK